jgi:hypothetical protein
MMRKKPTWKLKKGEAKLSDLFSFEAKQIVFVVWKQKMWSEMTWIKLFRSKKKLWYKIKRFFSFIVKKFSFVFLQSENFFVWNNKICKVSKKKRKNEFFFSLELSKRKQNGIQFCFIFLLSKILLAMFPSQSRPIWSNPISILQLYRLIFSRILEATQITSLLKKGWFTSDTIAASIEKFMVRQFVAKSEIVGDIKSDILYYNIVIAYKSIQITNENAGPVV